MPEFRDTFLSPRNDTTEYIARAMDRSGGDVGSRSGEQLARELMAATFSQGEWRRMGPRAVRKACEPKANEWQVPLPSPDSFSRAMGRRRK